MFRSNWPTPRGAGGVGGARVLAARGRRRRPARPTHTLGGSVDRNRTAPPRRRDAARHRRLRRGGHGHRARRLARRLGEHGNTTVNSLTGGEGIAGRADGSLLTRGLGSIPLRLRVAGWNHVGDPDIAAGDVFDAYQGGDGATSKMFEVTTASGQTYDYTHQLDAGELLNNSFATVSPDAQWLVAGEWGTMNRSRCSPRR